MAKASHHYGDLNPTFKGGVLGILSDKGFSHDYFLPNE